MKKIYRVLAAIAALSVLVSLLSACGKKGDGGFPVDSGVLTARYLAFSTPPAAMLSGTLKCVVSPSI